MFPMSNVVNQAALQHLVSRLRSSKADAAHLTYDDLVNEPLEPSKLLVPHVEATPGAALLSTDFYFIADGADAAPWSALEMDDAAVGALVGAHDIGYVFVRNISDPLVASTTRHGTAIAADDREAWSSLIYEGYGLYTSFNGALATWAAITATGA
jgi:hypothetical protein